MTILKLDHSGLSLEELACLLGMDFQEPELSPVERALLLAEHVSCHNETTVNTAGK